MNIEIRPLQQSDLPEADRIFRLAFGTFLGQPDPAKNLDRLLTACEALAASHGLEKLLAGVNTARHGAYRLLLARGFDLLMQGVAMQSSTEPGYNRPDCFVIDDWR